MSMMWCLAVLALAVLASGLVTAYVRPPDRVVRALVALVLFHFFTVAPIQLAAAAELSGVIDQVNLVSVALAAVVILVAVAGVCLGFGGAAAYRRDPARPNAAFPMPRYLVVIVGICIASWLFFAFNTVVSYDLDWDALAYHLPVALTWIQESSLAIPELNRWQHGLPANGELGMFLLLSAGLDRVVFLYNWLAFAVCLLSVFCLAQRITASNRASILCAALVAMVPTIQHQANSGYIDLYGASFILASIALFFERWNADTKDRSRWYLHALVLAGIACGIGIGAKPIYYAYGALCGLGAAIMVWQDQGRRLGPSFALSALLAGCMLVPCVFWLLRSLDATGNPFYPIGVTVMGVTIFEGFTIDEITQSSGLELQFVDSPWQWLIYPWVENRVLGGPPYGTGTGLGAAWATLVPIGLVFTVPHALRNLAEDRGRTTLALLILFLAMVVLWWFGLRRFPRFGLAFLALGCVMAAPLVAYLIARRPKASQGLLVLVFATAAVLSTFEPIHGILGRIRANEWDRAAVFEMPAIIDDLPRGTVIWNAGAGQPMNFALAGARLSNRVLSKSWRDPATAADFIKRLGVEYLVERAPYCCGEVESLGGRLVFEGRVGPVHDWRVWSLPKPGSGG